ncbi:MAG: hypothetical protein AAF243_16250 [Cyanobacteria bacterium P01_A01_bin.137]
MPPSVKSTVDTSTPQSGRLSRRCLFFLVATAAAASGLGIALGSTLRFQVLPVGQAPLFKPQQDFPPLAEWPPEVPSVKKLNDIDTNWNETPQPQLVYNERPTQEIEVEAVSDDIYGTEGQAAEDVITSEETADSATATDSNIENEPQRLTDEVFDQETLPPVVSTNTGELDTGAITDGAPLDNDAPATENSPWFDKQPASESQFTDGPVIIFPEESIPSPEPSVPN